MDESTSGGNAPETSGKRKDYLSWEEYFMSLAFLSGMRSKDPKTQVGACIVNEQKRIVGLGYNGMPDGVSDDDKEVPWDPSSAHENPLKTKTHYVCHAELNAVLNKIQADCRGCTMYVSLFPCNRCAQIIIQAGIKEVVYYSDKYAKKDTTQAAKLLFKKAGVKHRQYNTCKCMEVEEVRQLGLRKEVKIDFESVNETGDEQSGNEPGASGRPQ